jgi:5,10-methylenetetrahydromethanopterin reductase
MRIAVAVADQERRWRRDHGEADVPEGPEFDLGELRERLSRTEQAGLDTAWVPQYPVGNGAVAAIAALAPATSRIEIGTAILPVYPRNPLLVAQQAGMLHRLTGGRFTLGLGVALPDTIEGVYGIPYARPAATMESFLDRVLDCLGLDPAARPPVLVAAPGPRMLRLPATKSDGVILTYVNPRSVGEYFVPAVAAAAREAGRPNPAQRRDLVLVGH